MLLSISVYDSHARQARGCVLHRAARYVQPKRWNQWPCRFVNFAEYELPEVLALVVPDRPVGVVQVETGDTETMSMLAS
jgi:hypothetical protein